MKLKDLKGKHTFTGVEFGTMKMDWGEVNTVKFQLDGVTYVAVENPSDGYRSYMEDLYTCDDKIANPIPETDVVCVHKATHDDILEVNDVRNGKTILRVGTENFYHYYRVCIFEYSPENLHINKNGNDEAKGGTATMTNAENQWKDIMAQECKTGDWAINKYTKKVYPCGDCCQCLFSEEDQEGFLACRKNKVDWLNAEYKPGFSEEDKAVLRALDKVQWVVKNENGSIWGYMEKPIRRRHYWSKEDLETYAIVLNYITSATFDAIKPSDKEPTSRAEILGEE